VDGSSPVNLDRRIDVREVPFQPPRERPADAQPPKRRPDNKRRRKLLLGALAAVVLALGVGIGGYWYLIGRHYETTDDAYLGADNVTIAPKVGGYIAQLAVGDNQVVHKGDVLARIDPRDYQTAVDSAQADLDSAVANSANIDAQLKEQQAQIAQAQAAVTFAQQELTRYGELARSNVGTVQRQQQAQADLLQKQAALQAAQAHVAVLESQKKQANAAIEAKKAALDQARINLNETTIRAPVDGVVGDRTGRQGQFVQPGTRIMSVVPTGSIYIVANYKETQTGDMTPGQTATISIDSFPGQEIAGKVDSLAPGTGAQFALLPPENATGNFTKIVQRVPVKIVLDPHNPLAAKLRPGLSATVTVDIRPLPAVNQAAK
jgi:membrane fusion protein (multidrug efflux system)